MKFFPELSSGAVIQLASRSKRSHRTVSASTIGSEAVRSYDAGYSERSWDCVLEGLTADEVTRLETLFRECRGRHGLFVFPDPMENALAWSVDLTRPIWARDALVTIQGGADDPMGGSLGFQVGNGSGGHQTVAQMVTLPGLYPLSFSVWLRGSGAFELFLLGNERLTLAGEAIATWRRVEVTGRPGGLGSSLHAGIVLWPGTQLEVFGPQLVVGGLTQYRPSFARGGVYEKSRFADDELLVTQMEANQFRVRIRLIVS